MTTAQKPSSVQLRPVKKEDLTEIGRIVFSAFQSISSRHAFPLDFPTPEAAAQFAQLFGNHPQIWGVAAEENGRIIGSNFLTERNIIRGVGPITVDPGYQSKGIGRRLMQAVLERGKDARGIRLVQDAFNTASMFLYTSLGFQIREPLYLIKGKPEGAPAINTEVRPLTVKDVDACATLCRRAHGFDRSGELRDAIQWFGSLGAWRHGQLVAYASAPTLWPLNHGVAETEDDLKTLLVHAGRLNKEPIMMLVPLRQTDFFRWCLGAGMRAVKPMTLMTIGDYQDARTPYYPSVEY